MELSVQKSANKKAVNTFEIAAQTGSAFNVMKGQFLKVTTPTGRQVADLVCFNAFDFRERLSTARSADYADTIYLTEGHWLFSNRSRQMLSIIQDTTGRNDLLMPPCSLEMFHLEGGHLTYHPSCQENLTKNLARYSIAEEEIPSAFNIFMNVEVIPSGKMQIKAPLAGANATIIFRAEMDLIIGLTACSHEQTNDGACKPIQFEIFK